MNLKQALTEARVLLAQNRVEEFPLEAEFLLRHVLRIDRAQLYRDFYSELNPAQLDLYFSFVRRRCNGEPSAYITGHREFYGLEFEVTPETLIPRPETELLVEQAIRIARSRKVTAIAEIGTGCGVIAINLALNLPDVKIYATDISSSALEVAGRNCSRHGVKERVYLRRGDLLEALPKTVDLIVANLPYVKENDLPCTGPLSHEPVMALNGGSDGLEQISRLCHQVPYRLRPGGNLLLEIGKGQDTAVAACLEQIFPGIKPSFFSDLADIKRVMHLELTQVIQNDKLVMV